MPCYGRGYLRFDRFAARWPIQPSDAVGMKAYALNE
jgi:hypothetical protein